MPEHNHYQTLQIKPSATLSEIKQAYRRLVKLCHPDVKGAKSDRHQIREINAAYEVLSDSHQRANYDRKLFEQNETRNHQQSNSNFSQRPTGQKADDEVQRWLKQVYLPVNQLIARIINPLVAQIDALSADPFDDDLMTDFQMYLDDCRHYLNQAQKLFRSLPNPYILAGTAANLYYCLNQLGDAVEEFNFFTLNYDDNYLHSGQEMFRIAAGLKREAQSSIKNSRLVV
ncbi:J domain-containing protein [Merismopedia glauca]|uniref:Molecular chaperone DnaJ n=1 Tax=Merismopedia glauca CCAP 1448/3 TaxID=1296344 RepID=A0A2T1C356_9CYAN|nr:J domain-containing protein [Merismopedia glauca]PSB02699.1 molecular chaperone DnaJ [Merismopedia glauca CCAP 1448/3]